MLNVVYLMELEMNSSSGELLMLKNRRKTKIGFFNAVYMISKFEVELSSQVC